MKFKAGKSGAIHDAVATVKLTPMGDVYDCDWSFKARLGQEFFGKFIGVTQRESGSLRVHKDCLKEDVAKTSRTLEVSGVTLTRKTGQTYTFEKGKVSGEITFAYDGHDPVEIKGFRVKGLGMKLDFVAC